MECPDARSKAADDAMDCLVCTVVYLLLRFCDQALESEQYIREDLAALSREDLTTPIVVQLLLD